MGPVSLCLGVHMDCALATTIRIFNVSIVVAESRLAFLRLSRGRLISHLGQHVSITAYRSVVTHELLTFAVHSQLGPWILALLRLGWIVMVLIFASQV